MQIRLLPIGSLLLLFAFIVVFQNATLAQDVQPRYYDLPRGTAFQLVDESGTPLSQVHQFEDADGTNRLIYSNTLGRFVVPLPANQLVADDISTTGSEGCQIHRFTFQVVGRADPNAEGGAFSVQYALYQDCPGAYPKSQRDSLIIPGTVGKAALTESAFTVVVDVPPETKMPTTVYLGVEADRENVGMVMGVPPLVGHSSDRFDWPGFPCNAFLGGFPDAPHASANVEMWADTSCPAEFVGYRNHNPARFAINPGIGDTLADDIHMNINNCRMSSYEVTVKGVGRYVIDFRGACGPSAAIPGTLQEFNINTDPGLPQRRRFTFNPPILVPEDFWITIRTNNPESGIVMSGDDASTGHTEPTLGLILQGGECSTFIPSSAQGAFDLTITCDGSPPLGACCDMFVLDDNGDAVCREVPRMNCPFPPSDSELAQPKWVQVAACPAVPSQPGPFPMPCGLSACCGVYERTDPFNPDGPTILVPDCQNHTQNDCFSLQPFDLPRKWERGLYCGVQGQACPLECPYGESACCEALYTEYGYPCCDRHDPKCSVDFCPYLASLLPECRDGFVCGQGNVGSALPPKNVVDARRPFAPDDLLHPLGIDSAVINARIDIPSECFHLCETRPETSVNGIGEISTTPDGYAIQFLHPISPGSLVVIRQAGNDLNRGVVYVSHPGNANGDDRVDADDVLSLVARLKGGPALLWGIYSEDIDHSGMLTPLDLLDLIDLLNGAGAYDAWNGTPKPTPNAYCP